MNKKFFDELAQVLIALVALIGLFCVVGRYVYMNVLSINAHEKQELMDIAVHHTRLRERIKDAFEDGTVTNKEYRKIKQRYDMIMLEKMDEADKILAK